MDVVLRLEPFSERTGVLVLGVMVDHNVRQLRSLRASGRGLPLLYDSGVVYRRESTELWSDVLSLMTAGHEDCDGLAPARAAELIVYGARALAPEDGGYARARQLGLESIPAQAMLTTRLPRGGHGAYHVITRYRVGEQWFRDDPSARLGMYGGRIDAHVLARWRAAGVSPRVPLEMS